MVAPGRPAHRHQLAIWMNGELVGYWTAGGHRPSTFHYDENWLVSPNRRPLSLSMPLVQGAQAFAGPQVDAYFDNLLPDSLDIRKRLAARFGAESLRPFDLIEKIGRDCVGAVMVLPPDQEPQDVRNIQAETLSEAEVERLLDTTISDPGFGNPEGDELRISIAGAQEKTALLWHEGRWCKPLGATPTTHILKLPLGRVGAVGADFSTSVEVEWLSTRLMNKLGLPTANSRIERFGRHKVLVVERFDRRRYPKWIARLPQEDFCQALSVGPEKKYENAGGPGMAAILKVLRGSTNAEEDQRRFLQSQFVFWLMAAPDGHAKNFSIGMEREGKYRLTPLYDVMSAWPIIGEGAKLFQWKKVSMAMAVHGKNVHYKMAEIQRRHWNEMARNNGLGSDFEDSIQTIIARAPQAIEEAARELPSDFPAAIAQPVFEGILRQVALVQRQG